MLKLRFIAAQGGSGLLKYHNGFKQALVDLFPDIGMNFCCKQLTLFYLGLIRHRLPQRTKERRPSMILSVHARKLMKLLVSFLLKMLTGQAKKMEEIFSLNLQNEKDLIH